MTLRYLVRFMLLSLGVALVTYGAIAWHYEGLSLRGFLLYDNGWRPHPIHLIIVGLTLMPLSLWDIFVMEAMRSTRMAESMAAAQAPSEDASAEA